MAIIAHHPCCRVIHNVYKQSCFPPNYDAFSKKQDKIIRANEENQENLPPIAFNREEAFYEKPIDGQKSDPQPDLQEKEEQHARVLKHEPEWWLKRRVDQ